MNLTESLRIQAFLYPDRECVICEDRRVTFSELNKRANQIAHAFRELGLKRGDAVAVLLHNGYEWMEIFYAAARVGMPLVPVNYHFSPREILYIINHSESKAIIYGEGFAERIEAVKKEFDHIPEDRMIHLGEKGCGREYDQWVAMGSSDEAVETVDEQDRDGAGHGTTSWNADG